MSSENLKDRGEESTEKLGKVSAICTGLVKECVGFF